MRLVLRNAIVQASYAMVDARVRTLSRMYQVDYGLMWEEVWLNFISALDRMEQTNAETIRRVRFMSINYALRTTLHIKRYGGRRVTTKNRMIPHVNCDGLVAEPGVIVQSHIPTVDPWPTVDGLATLTWKLQSKQLSKRERQMLVWMCQETQGRRVRKNRVSTINRSGQLMDLAKILGVSRQAVSSIRNRLFQKLPRTLTEGERHEVRNAVLCDGRMR